MKKTITSALLGSVLLLSAPSVLMAQVRTERFDISAMEDNTVNYGLPETALYCVFEVEEELSSPGEFALYADRYLGVKNALMSERRSFVLRGIKTATYGVPNDTLRYSTRFGRHNSATNVILSQDGLLLGINVPSVQFPEIPASRKGKMEEDGTSGGGLSGMPREYVQATTTAKKAQIAADEIYRIRESRTAVISGESEQPFPDGDAMKVALSGLDRTEKALTEKFTGSVRRAVHVFTVKGIMPTEGEQIIARFSERYGLLDKDDLRGAPVYLSVRVIERAPALEERELRKKERQLSRGVVYTMPGRVMVQVTTKGKVVEEGEFPVAQYGHREALESVLFTDRDKITGVTLDPATGGILKIETF